MGRHPGQRPINLYTVSKVLLAGLTYVDIEVLTGWKKSTIRDLARRVGYTLPSPSEKLRSEDLLAKAICEDLATQGFTKYEASKQLRVPRSVVAANWPQYDIRPHVAELKDIAREALRAGRRPQDVAEETGLSLGQALTLARELRAERAKVPDAPVGEPVPTESGPPTVAMADEASRS